MLKLSVQYHRFKTSMFRTFANVCVFLNVLERSIIKKMSFEKSKKWSHDIKKMYIISFFLNCKNL